MEKNSLRNFTELLRKVGAYGQETIQYYCNNLWRTF